MNIQQDKLFYHLTTLDVFPSIVQNGLLSRGDLRRQNLNFVDTANHEILAGRERLHLSDRIPFHFHQYTAYDAAVKSTYPHKKFIYLCLDRNYAEQNDFGILPLHPNCKFWKEPVQVYPYQEGFAKIDWQVMELTKQKASEQNIDDNYHKQVKMAECLSPANHRIPIFDFMAIFVKDKQCKNSVEEILRTFHVDNQPRIVVNSFYFKIQTNSDI
ncbi:MAG: DUF4433 domain-containing protein [Oscillospiraceae bacterium]|nr:DUF4433 domain-containing protein [Oscillospiraceae bacterium]